MNDQHKFGKKKQSKISLIISESKSRKIIKKVKKYITGIPVVQKFEQSIEKGFAPRKAKVIPIKENENGEFLFQKYTINTFITQLDLYCSNTLRKYASKISDKKEKTGSIKTSEINTVVDSLSCTLNVAPNENGQVIPLNAFPYSKHPLVSTSHAFKNYKEMRDHYENIKGDRDVDSLERSIVELYKEKFINSYADGKEMISYFCNFVHSVETPNDNYDASYGDNHIIISFNINPSTRKSKNAGGTNDHKNKQNVDTFFKVDNIENWKAWQKDKNNVVLEGSVDINGITIPVLEESHNDWFIEEYKLNLDDKYQYIYVRLLPECLQLCILNQLEQSCQYKDTDVLAIQLKNAIAALLKNTQSLDGSYNQIAKLLSRCILYPREKDLNGISANTSNLFRDRNKNMDIINKLIGTSYFNPFDTKFCKKSWSDIFSVENISIEETRKFRTALNIKYRYINDKKNSNGIWGINEREWETFIIENVLPDLKTDFKYRSIAFDSPFYIPINGTLTDVFMKTQDGINRNKIENWKKDMQKNGFSPNEVIAFDKKYPDGFAIEINNTEDVLTDSSNFGDGLGKLKKGGKQESLPSCKAFEISIDEQDIHVDKNGLKFDRNKIYLSSDKSVMNTIDKYGVNLLAGVIEIPYPEYVMCNGEKIDTSNCTNFNEFSDLLVDNIPKMKEFELEAFTRLLEGLGGCSNIFYDLCNRQLKLIRHSTEKLSIHPSQLSDDLIKILEKIENKEKIIKSENLNNIISHYECLCPSCKHGHMIPLANQSLPVNSNDFAKLRSNFELLTPDTEDLSCPICGHITENPMITLGLKKKVMNKGIKEYHDQAIIKRCYLGSTRRNFIDYEVDGFKWIDGILNIYINYHYTFDATRLGGDIKSAAIGVAQNLVGTVKELVIPYPGEDRTKDKIFRNIPLDFSANRNTFKFDPTMMGPIKLVNAVHGTDYNLHDYVHDEFLELELFALNRDIWQHYKKSLVEVNLYDYSTSIEKQSHIYTDQEIEAFVLMITASPTEISQENFKFKKERKVGKQLSILLDTIGQGELSDLIYKEVSNFDYTDSNIRELIEIYLCLCHSTSLNDTNKTKNNSIKRILSKLTASVPAENNLNKILKNKFNVYAASRAKGGPTANAKKNVFNLIAEDRALHVPYMEALEYYKMSSRHPLLEDVSEGKGSEISKIFEKGTFMDVNLNTSNPMTNKREKRKYRIRFPSRKLMYSLINDNFNGKRVRLEKTAVEFLKLYELFCTSQFDEDGRFIDLYWGKSKNSNKFTDDNVRFASTTINRLKESILEILLHKNGKLDLMTSITNEVLYAKQQTGRIDMGLTVVGNRDIWFNFVKTELKKKALKDDDLLKKYGDLKELFLMNPYKMSQKREDGGNPEAYVLICQYEAININIREPQILPGQTTFSKIVYKSNVNCLHPDFKKWYPGFEGLMTNEYVTAREQQGDFDGDVVYSMSLSSKQKGSEIERKARDIINDFQGDKNGYYKNYKEHESDDQLIYVNGEVKEKKDILNWWGKKMLSDCNLKYIHTYVLGEAEKVFVTLPDNLHFDLYKAIIPITKKNFAIEQIGVSSSGVGKLTIGCWKADILLRFLAYYENSNCHLDITPELHFQMNFVFSVLILQEQGVRSMKSFGGGSDITLDGMMKNSEIKQITDWNKFSEVNIWIAFKELLEDFEKDYGVNFYSAPDSVYNTLINIGKEFSVDNAGEYFTEIYNGNTSVQNLVGKKDINGRKESMDKTYKEILGLFYVVYGRKCDSFMKTFGDASIFDGIVNEEYLSLDVSTKQINKDSVSNVFSKVPGLKTLGNVLKKIFNN